MEKGKVYISKLETGLGQLLIGDYKNQLCLLDWQCRAKRAAVDTRIRQYLNAVYISEKTRLHEEVEMQVIAYLKGELRTFELPIIMAGSDFQKSVWQTLLTITYGNTMSYLSLSKMLGDEKAIRAVANANGANSISMVIPCHRIIGSNRELIGYAGGLQAKKKLLALEGFLAQPTLF